MKLCGAKEEGIFWLMPSAYLGIEEGGLARDGESQPEKGLAKGECIA